MAQHRGRGVRVRREREVASIGHFIFLFHKTTADAFSNRVFVDWLREARVRDLVILGVFAEGCVRATVASALRRGFSVHVLVPGVASNASWKTRWALWLMRRRGARLVHERWFIEAVQASLHRSSVDGE